MAEAEAEAHRGDRGHDRDDDYHYDLDPSKWAPPVRNFYESIGKKIAKIRDLPDFPNPPACDLSKAVMPTGTCCSSIVIAVLNKLLN